MGERAVPLLERLDQHAAGKPDELALAFLSRSGPPEEMGWAALRARVRGLAAHLVRAGVRREDVLFVLSAAPSEQALGFLGALAAGALPSVLSFPSLKQSEDRFRATLEPIARSTGARWVLASADLAPAVARTQLQIGVLDFPAGGAPAPAGAEAPLPAPAGGFLQFSSGTTGLRKCVRITDRMLQEQAAAYGQALALGPADRIASWLPLYHDMGLVACLLLPLYQGLASVHLSPFDWLAQPSLLLRAVSTYRATLVWLPNFAYGLCAERIADEELAGGVDLGSLRAVINCSEPVRERAHALFAQRFGRWSIRPEQLQACYAMAEATFAVTQTAPGQPARLDRVQAGPFASEHRALPAAGPEEALTFVSCGRPIAGMEVRIAGAAGERQVGEIEVRGPSVIAGYGADGSGGRESFTGDGWYRTGDLGYLAEGELYVTGRAKDLIIHRGSNLYPTDVEEVVAEVPGCKPGRMVALGVYDEAQGTEEVVVLLEADGSREDVEALRREVRERVWARLNVAMRDVEVCEPGSLRKSTSGKLSRSANRALYLERRAAAPPAARPAGRPLVEPRDLLERQLTWIWEDVLGRRPLSVEDNLFLELGVDSVRAMQAAALVSQRLERELDSTAMLGAETIARQAELLRRQGAGDSPLVTLQRKGGGLPFFLVHAAGGWAFPYVALARHLGEERPVYAFQAPQLFRGGAASLTVPGMARDYLAAMKAVQPRGPYLLGGWSFGGNVAFEMACQLAAAGEPVAGLVLFDTLPPPPLGMRLAFGLMERVMRASLRLSLLLPSLRRFLPMLGRLESLSPVWRFSMAYALSPDGQDPRPLIEMAFGPKVDRRHLASLGPDAAWDYVLQIARQDPHPMDRLLLVPGLDGAGAQRALAVSRRLEMLNTRYRPRRYPGAVDIIGVRGNPMLHGWRPFVGGRLEIHPADVKKKLVNAHFDMMEEVNVERFAGTLREVLRRADGGR
jgi:acyl-CoA synthetase (AMP-forming)/AMP-acid ligase II/thioesterase domain-containing protein